MHTFTIFALIYLLIGCLTLLVFRVPHFRPDRTSWPKFAASILFFWPFFWASAYTAIKKVWMESVNRSGNQLHQNTDSRSESWMKKIHGHPDIEHRHQCHNPKCPSRVNGEGLIWQHDPNLIPHTEAGKQEYTASHACPACGSDQYSVYNGEALAQCRRNGHDTEWKPQPLPPEMEVPENRAEAEEILVHGYFEMSKEEQLVAMGMLIRAMLSGSGESLEMARSVYKKIATREKGSA